MSFDIAQYNSVVDGLDEFFVKVDYGITFQVPNARDTALDLPYVRLLPAVQRLVEAASDKIIEICQWIWKKIKEIYHGIRAPYEMYLQTCMSQSGAASTFSDIAEKARSAMIDASVGGVAFYAAILAACVNFLVGLARAIGELLSGIGAGISIADIAATSGMTAATAAAACTALVTFIGAQAKAMGDIDRSFPEGKWPDSQATSFNDASVEGDDKSSWKIA
ncbi:hypothetical protein [Nocardia aurea]|uniref:hypothetical protein n=1 Tax=Nocardia aurea TaxID=2144174 RepID=UPI0033BD4755